MLNVATTLKGLKTWILVQEENSCYPKLSLTTLSDLV